MGEFKGTKQAEKYATGKSSSSVFQEAHKMDFLAGYNKALDDSCALEMLEMLNEINECGYDFIGWDRLELLINKATEP